MAENLKKRPRGSEVDRTKKKRPSRSAEGLLAKRESDKRRRLTRICIGVAFPRWRALKEEIGLRSDTDVALILLDNYEKYSKGPLSSTPMKTDRNIHPPPPPSLSSNDTESQRDKDVQLLCKGKEEVSGVESRLCVSALMCRCSHFQTKSQIRSNRSPSTDSCKGVHEDPFTMSSSNEAEQDTAPSTQPSTIEEELQKKDATCQRSAHHDEQTRLTKSENKENRVKEDEDEEFNTSLSVGDGRYMVDLGSSSELIVDEECILELFKSCRKCNRQCTVRKHVTGLKLIVNQTCCFCQHHFQWTNLSDEDYDKDDSDSQINGQNSAMSPSSNTS